MSVREPELERPSKLLKVNDEEEEEVSFEFFFCKADFNATGLI